MRIAAVGEVGEDRYEDATGAVRARFLGGISANVALAAQRSGAAVSLFAAVGDDARGDALLAALDAAIPHHSVRRATGVSACQRVVVDPGGERRFAGYEAGVGAAYVPSRAELEELSRCSIACVPCSAEARAVFAALSSARSIRLAADFSPESPPSSADSPADWIAPHAGRLAVAFVGGREEDRGQLAALARAYPSLVIVLTTGAGGAHAIEGERSWHAPSKAARVVDTTGCGDAFAGAFLAAWVRGATLEACLSRGSEEAARVIEHLGATAVPLRAA